jgi:hypothetical protein
VSCGTTAGHSVSRASGSERFPAVEVGERLTASASAQTGVATRKPAGRAEGEGFEPSRDETAPNGFRDRRIRPLCHPSGD